MNEAVRRYIDAASGLGDLTKRKAEQVVKGLVRSGEAASDQANDLVRDLIERQQRNRDSLAETIRSETKRVVRTMGLATAKEMERLETEVARLKRELAQARRQAGGTTARKATAKKATAKKATAKKATAKKAAAKKAAAKKSAGKKATKRTST